MKPNAPIHTQMPSGRLLSLVNPKPEHIHFPDIAEMLAKTNRFAGGTTGCAYSVAQHSCLVSDHLPPEARLAGLLHDAHEAVLGDWVTPFKNAVQLCGGTIAMGALQRLEKNMAAAIHHAAFHPWPLTEMTAHWIKQEDMAALATEKRDLMAAGGAANDAFWQGLGEPWKHTIKPWPWPRAADEWMHRFHHCTRLYDSDGDFTGAETRS